MGITSVIIIAVVTLVSFNIYRRMHKKPKTEQGLKINASKNYKNGVFENSVKTDMTRPPLKVLLKMMDKKSGLRPEKPLQTLAIDGSLFENSNNETFTITWLGHSSFLIRAGKTNILIDPVLSKRASLSQHVGPKQFDYTHFTNLNELPEIDLVLISHNHYDHLDYHLIKALKNRVKMFYVPLGVDLNLQNWGIDSLKIQSFDWWDKNEFDDVKVTATPARHFTGRGLSDRFKTLWCGWAIKWGGKSLFFSGDSGYFDGFKTIGEKLGPFTLSLIECGQYSPYWPHVHMSPEESVQAAIDVKSQKAMPMHWGKFNLSIHAWNEPPTRFLTAADLKKLQTVIPQIGKTFSINESPLENWWR